MTPKNMRVALATLKPHPRNYNRHPASQVERIAASLRKFGQVRSIVVWRSTILAGHGVVEAARALGWTELNADVLPDEYPEHLALAYVAADNELSRLGDPDQAALAAILEESRAQDAELLEAMGYSDKEFQALLEEVGATAKAQAGDTPAQVDRAEELRQKWQVEPGQLWQLGEHRLICGDCTDAAVVARVMGGEKADMVFTDPPFATFASSTGKLEITDFGMIRPFYEKLLQVNLPHVEKGRGLFICCDWRSYPMLFGVGGIDPKNLIVWVHGALRMGTANFRPQHEFILYALNVGFSQRFAHANSDYKAWKIEDRGAGDVWQIGQAEASPSPNRIHVSQKPVALSEKAIGHGSVAGEIVGDWFSGSGTTLIACENLGRRCRAVEISPAYVAVALERWATHTGKTPVLIG